MAVNASDKYIGDKEIEFLDNQIATLGKYIKQLENHYETLVKRKESIKAAMEYIEKYYEEKESLRVMQPSLQMIDLEPLDPLVLYPIKYKTGKKTDPRVIQEILEQTGPLHIADIIFLARERGVTFSGKRSIEEIARAKLSASKRFQFLGDGVWGLANNSTSTY